MTDDARHHTATPPRRWRPSPLYVMCAVIAIALLLVWLFSRGLEPAGPAVHPTTAPSSAPGR